MFLISTILNIISIGILIAKKKHAKDRCSKLYHYTQ